MSGSPKQEAPTEDTRASTQMSRSSDRGGSHPPRDTDIIRLYRDHGESQRSIARSLGTTRGTVIRCLDRHKIAKRPLPLKWTEEDRWRLLIICNSLNNEGQHVTGQEFKKFFPNHTYSSIKHHKDVLRQKNLIR